MKNKTIIFYDFESTGISREADMVSVGLVAITEKYYIKATQSDQLTMYNESSINITKGKDYEVIDNRFIRQFEENNTSLEYIDIKDNQGEIVTLWSTDFYPNKLFKKTDVKIFYAEFTDFNLHKADEWVKDNIINKLNLPTQPYKTDFDKQIVKGNSGDISKYLKEWLAQFEEVEFWADYDVIDKPMLIDLIADWNIIKNEYPEDGFGSWNEEVNWKPEYEIGLPKHLPNIKYYDFYDLHTLFKVKGINPDINREEFAEITATVDEDGTRSSLFPQHVFLNISKHNALYDSYINWKCYEKLMKL